MATVGFKGLKYGSSNCPKEYMILRMASLDECGFEPEGSTHGPSRSAWPYLFLNIIARNHSSVIV